MSDLKITPGPWEVSSGMVQTPKGIPIAYMDREPGNGTMPVERDANAQAIAALPDLIAALGDCLTDDGAYSMTRNDVVALQMRIATINAIAKAAIKKAQGRQ